MRIPINLLFWSIAALPILLLLVLMIGLKWSAMRAAPIGLLTACISSLLLFQADIGLILMAIGKGLWSAAVILIVVWSAILLYEITNEAKALGVLRKSIQGLSPNELLQIMALGWVFSSFLQGITGFGVAVAVGAPLLVAIGMKPLWAVITTLICHSWGNTFGTLALAWEALITQSGTMTTSEIQQTALWACALIWLYNLFGGLCLCWFYGKWEAIKKGLPAVLVISLLHGGGQLVVAQYSGTLACFLPACLAFGALFFLGKTKAYSTPWRIEHSPVMERKAEHITGDIPQMRFSQAFFPYAVLTGVTLFVLLIPPVKNTLNLWQIGFSFPEMTTGYGFTNAAVASYSPLAPLTYAGTFLFVSVIAAYFFFKKHGWICAGAERQIITRVVKKTVPSSIAVISFIAMSRVMGGTGQTEVLAQGIAAVLGTGYILFAPMIGLLGSFMTSSNMASNILFGQFQMTTATILQVPFPALLGGQTAGGAIGGSICPGNIILGAATVGLQGQEGLILKKVLPIALVSALLCGVILYVLLVVFSI